MAQPRVLTVGTGAIGSIYSWRLSKSCQVTTVCRSNYETVRDHGFEIESVKFGNGTFRPHHVVRSVSDAQQYGPFDYLLVTLKALPDVYSVPDIIAPGVTEGHTCIVLIQNGLGIEQPVVDRFPNNPLVSVVAYIGTSQIMPGRIRMRAVESLALGTYPGCKVDSEPARAKLIEKLEQGDVNAFAVDDIVKMRWEKLFWNGSFNPVCALLRMDTTQVTSNESALNLVKRLMREIMTVAGKAVGQEYEIEHRIEALIEGTKAEASNYKPSMQLDLERGQPMEVEVILGTAMRCAKEHGIPVPTLELVHEMCRAVNIQNTNRKSQL